METKLENTANSKKKLDILFWTGTVFLVAFGVVANSYFSELAFALRLAGWIVIIAIAMFFALHTTQGRKFWKFAIDARIELLKVVWPTRQETVHVTMIVIGLVILMALIMWGVDSILLWALSFLTG